MLKFQYHGEIIAIRPTKYGKQMVSVWNFDDTKLPIIGVFSPHEPEALPEKGEGIYMVVIGKKYTTITPLKSTERRKK